MLVIGSCFPGFVKDQQVTDQSHIDCSDSTSCDCIIGSTIEHWFRSFSVNSLLHKHVLMALSDVEEGSSESSS